MTDTDRSPEQPFEQMIAEWRTRSHRTGEPSEVINAREESLRGHFSALSDGSALSEHERFIIAIGRVDAESADGVSGGGRSLSQTFLVMLACALAATLAVRLPSLFGLGIDSAGEDFFVLNLSLFVLPFLAAYFAWSRKLNGSSIGVIAAAFGIAALAVNLYPFEPGGSTQILTTIHLPIALWIVMGVAHSGGEWKSHERRQDFVRFTGEWLVNFALIALGGGVLSALTFGTFEAIGLDASPIIEEWLFPVAAGGAVIVAAWLADTRRSLVGGVAPMLARVFTPLFAGLLVALLIGVAVSRGVVNIERDVLLIFDLLLVIVLALLLYGIASRRSLEVAGLFDWVQFALVAGALLVDVVVLGNMVGRLTEFGFSPNRVAVIGLNLVLLVALTRSAVLQLGFVRRRRGIAEVEAWHMGYVPVYAAWAATVALVFPLIFAFS